MQWTESRRQPQALPRITAAALGSAHFKSAYGIKYAYLAGAMYKGIASKEMVISMAKAGLMDTSAPAACGWTGWNRTSCSFSRNCRSAAATA